MTARSITRSSAVTWNERSGWTKRFIPSRTTRESTDLLRHRERLSLADAVVAPHGQINLKNALARMAKIPQVVEIARSRSRRHRA